MRDTSASRELSKEFNQIQKNVVNKTMPAADDAVSLESNDFGLSESNFSQSIVKG